MKNLWRVPVLCLAGSWIGFYLTVYMERFFFLVKNQGQNGIPEIYVDPVRSLIFNLVLFFLILFVGGIWFLRGMTKKEIALSAAITSGIYLVITVLQISVPMYFGNINGNMILAIFQNWPNTLISTLYRITDNFTILFTFLSCFSPFLFVFFGKRKT